MVRFRLPAVLVVALALCVSLPARAQTVTYEKETTPFPGVRLLERHTANPNWRIFAAYVELCHDGVRIDARSSQSVRITAPAWGKAMGAQLATNGDFFRTDTTIPTVYGDAVGVGMRWPTARSGLGSAFSGDWYYQHYGWIAFGDGWVELDHTEWVKKHAADLGITQGWRPDGVTTQIPAGTRALVSGFPELVVEGKALSSFPDRGDASVRHPRTAMGLSKDRHTFMLVVVNGRTTASVGMTGAELATLMKGLGAYTAFNLDGGGSSQMWMAGKGTVNAPSDGSPRPVANLWGVFADGSAMPARHCFTAGGCFPSPVPAAANARFADLPDDDAAAGAAARVVDSGLLSTCGATPRETFCPHCELTRGDALAMIVRAAGIDTGAPPATPTFSDVPADADGYAEIEAAAALGITTGCGDGKFCPDEEVTRGQLAAFLARARGWSDPAPSSPSFDDVPADHPLAAEIEATAAHCVPLACKDDSFCPDQPVERADGAVVTVAGFDLAGNNPCANANPDPPDNGGDGGNGGNGGSGDGKSSGGCSTGGGAPLLPIACAMLLAVLRRR